MTIRQILTEPDPQLRIKSKPVKEVDREIKNLMKDMLETMYAAPGIGLAAVQIGVHKRVVVIDIAKEPQPKNPIYLVNPEIVWSSKTKCTYEEGCLSLPKQFAEIERPDQCHVKYLDEKGKEQLLKAEGLLSTCIQHEIDHLNGVLFIDYLSKLKKSFILKKLSKAKKEAVEDHINF
jgi:peptide deformylase